MVTLKQIEKVVSSIEITNTKYGIVMKHESIDSGGTTTCSAKNFQKFIMEKWQLTAAALGYLTRVQENLNKEVAHFIEHECFSNTFRTGNWEEGLAEFMCR